MSIVQMVRLFIKHQNHIMAHSRSHFPYKCKTQVYSGEQTNEAKWHKIYPEVWLLGDNLLSVKASSLDHHFKASWEPKLSPRRGHLCGSRWITEALSKRLDFNRVIFREYPMGMSIKPLTSQHLESPHNHQAALDRPPIAPRHLGGGNHQE